MIQETNLERHRELLEARLRIMLTDVTLYKDGFVSSDQTVKILKNHIEALEAVLRVSTFGHDLFVCDCGNHAGSSGFHPCDITGAYVEPDMNWEGHYKCDDCKKVYKSLPEV